MPIRLKIRLCRWHLRGLHRAFLCVVGLSLRCVLYPHTRRFCRALSHLASWIYQREVNAKFAWIDPLGLPLALCSVYYIERITGTGDMRRLGRCA